MICSAKKGVSAAQLKRELKTQLRDCMVYGSSHPHRYVRRCHFCEKFSGIVEADETYVGGKGKGPRGRSTASKVPVMPSERGTSGKVRMQAVENVSASVLASFIRENVTPEAPCTLMSFPRICGSIAPSSRTMREPLGAVALMATFTPMAARMFGASSSAASWACSISLCEVPALYLDEFSFRFNNRDEFNLMDKSANVLLTQRLSNG